MNGFITVKEATEKWNIGVRRVNTLCLEGRIPGVSKVGNVWAIPEDAEKPSAPCKTDTNQMIRG